MKYGTPKVGEIYTTIRHCQQCKKQFNVSAKDILLPVLGKVREIIGNMNCKKCSLKENKSMYGCCWESKNKGKECPNHQKKETSGEVS